MITNRDDDYLICKHYYNNIKNISAEYSDFITFVHNDNHFFAWVNDGKVILRSEAYPSQDKMERGIKAILKNRDLHERYSIDSQHGVHFLVLWGGGNHQKHTGNFDKHNEIGRSCPVKTKEELFAMMGFMGKDFTNGVFRSGSSYKSSVSKGAGIAAATAGAASLSATSKSKGKATYAKAATTGNGAAARASAASSEGGGFKWWYLLPLLLIPLLFLWKGCGGDTTNVIVPAKTELSAKAKADEAAKLATEKEIRLKAELDAKTKADAAQLAADAETKAAKSKKGSGGVTGKERNSNSVNFSGNKNSGF